MQLTQLAKLLRFAIVFDDELQEKATSLLHTGISVGRYGVDCVSLGLWYLRFFFGILRVI